MGRTLTERADALPALAEVFREYGFERASLSLISIATGLGKGSLYNFFPGGKEEMMTAVLAEIDAWFNSAIFSPLEVSDPAAAIRAMFRNVDGYFQSGGRVCLVGWVGMSVSRDSFAEQVKAYFGRWITTLAVCLEKACVPRFEAISLSEETVAGVQGALVLSRALGSSSAFKRIMGSHEDRLESAIAHR